MNLFRKSRLIKIALLVVMLAALFVGSFGCTNTSTPLGWGGPVVIGNNLYIASMEGQLVTLDTATRNRVGVDYTLTGLPTSSGMFSCSVVSSIVPVYGSPVVNGNVICVGGYEGRLHFINVSDNTESVYPTTGDIRGIVGNPAFDNGTLYFGAADSNVYAVGFTNKDTLWTFTTGDRIWATPTVSAGTVYIGSFDKKLYALNTADGTLKWEFATEGAIISKALVSDDKSTIFIGSFDRNVYALNAADGSLKWKSAVPSSSWFWANTVINDNVIYAPSVDGNVYAYSTADGSLMKTYNVQDSVSSSPVVVNGVVIVCTQTGKLFSISAGSTTASLITNLAIPVRAPLYAAGNTVYVHGGAGGVGNDFLYGVNIENGSRWNILLGS